MKGKILYWINKHKIGLLTILSGIIGAIVFVFIYGTKVLNVTETEWIFRVGDLSQHQLGWEFFRKADWSFPIGLFNTLSYPNYASIIFTDSIPLFAVIFKIFSEILPETFQYFGIYRDNVLYTTRSISIYTT